MLGIFVDQAQTGKPAGSDVREAKQTLLIHHALHQAPPADQALLRKWLGNHNIGPAGLQKVRQLLIASGTKAYMMEQIDYHYDQALRRLAGLGTNAVYRRCVQDLIIDLWRRHI